MFINIFLICFIFVMLLPGFICTVTNKFTKKLVPYTTILYGMTFTIYPAYHYWRDLNEFDHSFRVIAPITKLMLAWGGAAMGWALSELSPVFVRQALEFRMKQTKRRLLERRGILLREWHFQIENH